jgi:acetate kinase
VPSSSAPVSTAAQPLILTINGGSSSIRFALYENNETLRLQNRGKLDRIGAANPTLNVSNADGTPARQQKLDQIDFRGAIGQLLQYLEQQHGWSRVSAVGHRVVHGMGRARPERITPDLMSELRRNMPFAPEHLPPEIELIDAVTERCPQLPQVACFDTAFHHDMPAVARLLPIPRRYEALGVRRYGFHGLSYAFLMEELQRLGDPTATRGRVILAHLGNGASMAAVGDGRSLDTSMGFTPAAGLVMGTRSGDLDPGLAFYLAQTEHQSAAAFQKMVNHESGLKGVSQVSSDMHDLLAREATDPRAAEAVALFCYQARKWLGAFAATLGGLDTLVFAGGIGENAPPIRARICAGLQFLGITLDEGRNSQNAPVISAPASSVTVRVIRTDEELMIARSVARVSVQTVRPP